MSNFLRPGNAALNIEMHDLIVTQAGQITSPGVSFGPRGLVLKHRALNGKAVIIRSFEHRARRDRLAGYVTVHVGPKWIVAKRVHGEGTAGFKTVWEIGITRRWRATWKEALDVCTRVANGGEL